VQLSGGEPTLRDDLPAIVALGNRLGFPHVQVNTNGIRIGRDKDYLWRLKDAGLSVVFLQWDGLDDNVFRRIRGANLLDNKLRALDHCAELHVGVILVPTLVPGINMSQIGEIVRFAKTWIPVVKGIHFQPISYFGRYPSTPRDNDRVTIPEVLDCIERQTGGEIKRSDFLDCEPRYCSFSGLFVLMEDGRLVGMSGAGEGEDARGCCEQTASERARSYIDLKWRYREQQSDDGGPGKTGSWLAFYHRARSHYLSISGMAFQDIWNLDLDRLKRCCVHVATPEGRLVPFCAHYLTGASGQRLQSMSL
jgi:uncharacterized radical SAM superfamily Fe-S cluster-containing enzyme